MKFFAVVGKRGQRRIWIAEDITCIEVSPIWSAPAMCSADCERAKHSACRCLNLDVEFRDAFFPDGVKPGDIREIDVRPLKLKARQPDIDHNVTLLEAEAMDRGR